MDKNNNHVFLIAEIGINHNGDLDIVKKLISDAAEAGFDAVKFQKRTVEKVYTKEYLDNFRESPWGKTQREQKNGLEFNIDQYKLIEKFCKEKKTPAICFPRGLNKKYLQFAEKVNPHCLNLDYEIDPVWAKINLKNFCLQGGMDPNILFKSENEIFKEVDKYLTIFKDTPYIFNLGHGLLPKTNPDTLKKVIDRVNNFR